MFTPRTGVLAGLICVSTGASASLAQVASQWTLELQCRSSLEPGLSAFNLPFPSSLSSQYVSIGENGDVAIRVVLSGAEGVFYGANGAGEMIFTANSLGDPVWSTTLDLRNDMIAIEMGSFSDGAQLYDTSGSLIRNFGVGGPEGVSGFSGVTLTSDGAICYRADSGSIDKLIVDEFINDVRTQTKIAQTGSGQYSFLFAPEINDARQVVSNTIPSGNTRRIIRFDHAGIPTTIAETGGVWNSFVNSTAIAQNGDVAFSARRSSDSIWEINRWDGSAITMIASGDNADIQNGSIANFPPVVNSNGIVAFRASDVPNDSTAIWVGDGTDLFKLIEWGQVVETDIGPLALGFDFGGFDGRQVTSGVIDINDNGQVAFSAFLSNGTVGVFVATPNGSGCVVDFNNDGVLNFFDVSAFISAFGKGDPEADLTKDGELNFFDISAFLNAFGAGCP
jgi:hypothetical protein